ncbi:ankyrin repeat domain-containing protein 40 isoform X2 [Narcine bancroftii]|uniref:ankyrin repeat domain-containing protein 40 isoform X2 n=1 Tax=Narcine bancroftii TaxID=1343680 RepID=UPI0038318C8B
MGKTLRKAGVVGGESSVRTREEGAGMGSGVSTDRRTCLHWACKRAHPGIVSDLLAAGADKEILTAKGESAAQLTSKPEIRAILGVDESTVAAVNGCAELPIIPNYLANPPLPLVDSGQGSGTSFPASTTCSTPLPATSQWVCLQAKSPATSQLLWRGAVPEREQELVLKVRLHNPTAEDDDFIEVELDRCELTFQALLRVTCQELAVSPEKVEKIRKLPNTLLRKDKDVMRLENYQELELVLVKGDSGVESVQVGLTERPCYNPVAASLIY